MYPHQRDRLSEVLEREGLAALVATSAENVFYVTGFRSLTAAVFRTLQFAVFTPRGTALVVPAIDLAPIVVDAVAVDHVACFGAFVAQYAEPAGEAVQRLRELADRRAPSPAEALAGALEALGAGSGAVGLDPGGLTPPVWEAVGARLQGRKVVPAADLFWAARRIKGPWELECLQRALGVVEEAVNAVLQTLKPGVTEREALSAYETEVITRGALPAPGSIAIGDRTWIPAPPATDRALRPGELVRFDVSAVFKGYWASLARTAVMGHPDRRQEAAWKAVEAGLEAAIAAVKPGVPAARVHEAAVETVRAAGLPDYRRYHVGHGIGLEPYERPKLAADTATPLEMGDVLRIEVPYYAFGWAGMNVRDTVVVTRAGSRPLNRSVHALVTLD